MSKNHLPSLLLIKFSPVSPDCPFIFLLPVNLLPNTLLIFLLLIVLLLLIKLLILGNVFEILATEDAAFLLSQWHSYSIMIWALVQLTLKYPGVWVHTEYVPCPLPL